MGKITPININLTKKLNPIAKKNLINQLKAHLAKDSTISNYTNNNTSNTNYNIMNFNFYKTPKNEVNSNQNNSGETIDKPS